MLEHLPRDNPAARELYSVWGDDQWIAYDISSQLRALRAEFFNAWKAPDQEPATPDFLPTPDADDAPEVAAEVAAIAEQQQTELLAALNRPNPH